MGNVLKESLYSYY